MPRYRSFMMLCLIALFGLLLNACASTPPDKERLAAEAAFAQAEPAKDCASLKYQSAEEMLNQARRLETQAEYDEARKHYNVAKKLAEEAHDSALTQTDCLREHGYADEEMESSTEETDENGPNVGSAGTPATAEHDDYNLEMVHFPFDSYELTDETREILGRHVEWMVKNKALVRLVGHCDERGSAEYNLALGEQRAFEVRQYLIQNGVPMDDLEIVSMGEEKPLSYEHSEEAYAQNRRVEFVKQGFREEP